MKLAIVGSRTINKNIAYKAINTFVEQLDNIVSIVTGGAKGVDSTAKDFAINNNIALVEFLPKYSIYGRRATLVRNQEIVNNADLVLALWDSKSKGTKHSINYARKQNKEVFVINL